MATVGLLGLGGVGLAIARRLLATGVVPLGYRRGPPAAFAALGGVPCASPRELLERCDLIVGAAPAGAAAALADEAAAAGAGTLACRTLVDVGVGALDERRRIHDRLQGAGITMLDAPVMGNPPLIEAGRAVVYVGGDAGAAAAVQPLLRHFAAHAPHVGPFGHGTRLKLASNLLLAVHTAAAAEAVAYLQQAGVDPRLLLEHLPPIGRSGVFDARGPQMVERRFVPGGGTAAMLLEVVDLIVADAAVCGCRLRSLEGARGLLGRAVEAGLGDADASRVVDVVAAPPR